MSLRIVGLSLAFQALLPALALPHNKRIRAANASERSGVRPGLCSAQRDERERVFDGAVAARNAINSCGGAVLCGIGSSG